ncbi:SGNH/GDSL hydrolase family protein [Novosphingobium flavum]|uniref:SGNH/GDSL hydrolase family protein n=1 Tax=Novosphingobium flavum TaxID=1778672 RepID=UPI001C8BD5E9|nr:hypothetical protein [Novosphingobium flavum]
MTLFAKGNVDVHDSLHSCRIGGELLWNGVNECLRHSHPEARIRMKHETLTRFDALLAADGHVPQALADRDLALGSYPLPGQFSDKLFTTPVDAVILSILPDVAAPILRHKEEGFLLYPADTSVWPESDRAWLRDNFEAAGLSTVEAAMANLEGVVERLREAADVPVLVYNMSPAIPGDMVHCHLGLDDTYSTRIRRFNLALIELSQAIGISIVDLDGIVARKGADTMKVDAMHLTPLGYQCVAEEVVRILDDYGIMEEGGAGQ